MVNRVRTRSRTLTVRDSLSRDATTTGADGDYFNKLSLELLCHILDWLPLSCIMRIEHLCRNLHRAVDLHLRLLLQLDFTEQFICGNMSTRLTDVGLLSLLRRCPELRALQGLHPPPGALSRRSQRGSSHASLSVAGVVTALQQCGHLRAVETSDLLLLEAVLSYLPHVDIAGTFRNRERAFPAARAAPLCVPAGARLSSLDLSGAVIAALPFLPLLHHLQLRWVRFQHAQPFHQFVAPELRTFVMRNCAGPPSALAYVPLVATLAAAGALARLELVRVPFLGGVIQRMAMDSWPFKGFSRVNRLVIGTCKHVLEVDIGYLIIACRESLKELLLQPGLSRDSFFTSLRLADVEFPNFEVLYLGFVDDFPPPGGKWSNKALVRHGLADIIENPAHISDVGMKSASHVLHNLSMLTIYNCPHLHYPTTWFSAELAVWAQLRVLCLRRCHAVRLHDFCRMLTLLPSLQSLQLEHMFREPPKGCSRVGLSAGTGLGVSSALVSNNGTGPVLDDVEVAPPAPPAPPGGDVPANDDVPDDDGGHEAAGGDARQAAATDGGDSRDDDGGGKRRRLIGYIGKGKSPRARTVGKRSRRPDRVDCACQAVSEEIRECTKKARPADGGQVAPLAAASAAKRTWGRRAERRSSRTAGQTDVCDKATSTSDPVIEDDRVQVLTICSASLVNIRLYYVGITTLVVKQATSLRTLTGQACRVLRSVHLRRAHALVRVSFTQCGKLRHDRLIDEVCSQPATCDRFISLQPAHHHDIANIERQLFHSATYNFHVCLLHVGGVDEVKTRCLQRRAASWQRAAHLVNLTLLKGRGFRQANRTTDMCYRYPWGRNIYRCHELAGLENGVVDIAADIPWLRSIISEEMTRVGNESGDSGSPGLEDACELSHCLSLLADDVHEAKEANTPLHTHSVFVYVNMADITPCERQANALLT